MTDRRDTNDLHIANVIDLRKYEAPEGWAFHDTSTEDLAADDADLEFLLQPPRDLTERTTIRRSNVLNRVLLRLATMFYAFLFGVALATGYEMISIILIGVALACAWVVVETL